MQQPTTSQLLPEAADLTYLSEAECLVRRSTDIIRELGIRGELSAALGAGPVLRCRNQRPAQAAPPRVRLNVPPL
jgi:hypothetical protein